ncbi:MAG: hypothetical protein LBM97_00055 [Candidatus Nomurabacteria bacterium]|jgi:D-lactate dehydrogenase|nr:hypothetical protein [Candidatus Nomurabacteria bacterium]
MKFIAYTANSDEHQYFKETADEMGIEYVLVGDTLNEETVELAAGCDGVSDSMLSKKYDEKVYARLHELGVKYFTVRSVGYDTLDFGLAKKYDLRMANVPAYSPNAIAEHALMLALNLVRKNKIVQQRMVTQDFRRENAVGSEIGKMTVGIIGTGNIGFETAKIFHGFGARVIGHDHFPRKDTGGFYEEVKTEDDIFAQADLISIHVPLFPETTHFINEANIAKMKDGVIIINTARGPIIKNSDLLKGLLSGKVGGAGLDVFEFDSHGREIYGEDFKGKIIKNKEYREMSQLPNVMLTPHVAYNTDVAVGNMVKISSQNLLDFLTTGECKNEVLPK